MWRIKNTKAWQKYIWGYTRATYLKILKIDYLHEKDLQTQKLESTHKPQQKGKEMQLCCISVSQ